MTSGLASDAPFVLVLVLLGLSAGSFVNCAVDRLPRGRSLLPRSRCDGCQRPLTAAELVPVVSYLWLYGRCRSCGAVIPWRAPLVEGLTAALALVCWLRLGATPAALVAWAHLTLLLAIAVVDLEHRRVLNWLVAPAMLLAVPGAGLWPGLSLLDSLLGGLAGFAALLLLALARPGAMGMGDVKLAGLVGLLSGLSHLAPALAVAFISGGAVAGALLLTGRIGRRDTLPFAPFLCLGAVVAMVAAGW